ncbi:glycosyltransferase family 4 protein [Roseinatronobacter sp. S2]|nr:glycosyltransferase family 4 protein [Roseinatronobacter sp. S2]
MSRIVPRPRVLVIAEAANPEWVSVPLVGWQIASALRRVADVHLVTQVRNRDAVLRAGLMEGQDFTVIDSEALARPVWALASWLRMGEGKGWTMLTALASLSYPYFERLVWKQFGPAIRSGAYDIVHRVTPLSPTANSSLASKCASAGVPFVLGPLNGGVPWPAGFDAERRREREWLSYVRGLYRLLPGRARMLRNCAALIAGSRHTLAELGTHGRERGVYIPENGVNPDALGTPSQQDVSGPLRCCFVGRLVPYKGPDILIEALLPLLQSGRVTLDIVGSGPMEDVLRQLVQDNALEGAVTFHGWLDHAGVGAVLSRANLLTFPSVREFGGGVVVEAMALGVVPVVCDYAGPGELVTARTGFKVPMAGRFALIAAFRQKVTDICDSPDCLPRMGADARELVRTQFTWPRKADHILQVYEWVTGKRDTRPQPFQVQTGDTPDVRSAHKITNER